MSHNPDLFFELLPGLVNQIVIVAQALGQCCQDISGHVIKPIENRPQCLLIHDKNPADRFGSNKSRRGYVLDKGHLTGTLARLERGNVHACHGGLQANAQAPCEKKIEIPIGCSFLDQNVAFTEGPHGAVTEHGLKDLNID